jgi:putative Mn2+ efflux pump MntP
MNLIEILMISVGLSLDVYAVVVCQGAVLLKIERSKLFKMCLIFCIWQGAAVEIGNLITCIPYLSVAAESMQKIWHLISVIIFFALGVYMLYKAWKNQGILERLSEINYKQICIAACFTSIDALFAGMGFGFLKTGTVAVVLSILIVTALAVIVGLYTGYRLGYEQKTKAYGVGGILLLISAVNIIVKFLVV